MGFQKVEEVLSHVGGKVLVFGKQGTGKSTFVGTFPNINLVDTEDGQTYYLGKNKNIKPMKVEEFLSDEELTQKEINRRKLAEARRRDAEKYGEEYVDVTDDDLK